MSMKTLSIQPPDTRVQNHRKTYPQQVRDEQIASYFINFSKLNVSFINHEPEDYNFQQSQHRVHQPKEQIGPQRIQGQLQSENHQRFFDKFRIRFYSIPNQSCSNSHHNIKRTPYWCKNPIRRIKTRFYQSGIPSNNCSTGDDS